MPKFILSEQVDVLEYDFRTTSNPEGPVGVIPEPSNGQLARFRKTLTELIPTVPDGDGSAKIDLKAMAERVKTEQEGSELETALYQAVSDLCSGTPSVEQLRGLSFRGQRAFVGWIMGTFASDPQ